MLNGWLGNTKVLSGNTGQSQTNPYVTIREVKIIGSSVLPSSFFENDLRQIQGQPLELDELQARLFKLIETINQWYEQQGYLASGAYLPIQDLSDGSVEIQILEGQLAQIDLKNCKRLCNYAEERINLGRGVPLRNDNLIDALERLRRDPLIENLKASLEPGQAPNERLLQVGIEEAPTWQIETNFNNYESVSVGELQFMVVLNK